MADEKNTDISQVDASRDESLDISALMAKKEPKKEEASPLEKAMKHEQKGMVVNTDALKTETHQFRQNYDTDESREGFEEKLEELDDNAKKARAVVVVKKPTNQMEDAQMMDEIMAVKFDENGKAIVPEGAMYIVAKEDVAELEKKKTEPDVSEETSDDPSSYDETEDDSKRKEIINILIDKTGLGRDFTFTDEEEKLIEESKEIHIKEVEDLTLRTAKVKRIEDEDLSFMDTVDKYQLSVSKTHMSFPLSGFSAEMTGLSYGEFGDITLDQSDDSIDELTFEKIWKMLTVIYNKMINPTCGRFKNFDDFLMKFAWKDVPLATYALLISTQPEIDTIGMKCNSKECGKNFDHKYSTRGLIDFDDCTDGYLALIDGLANAKGHQLFEIAKNSLVRNVKRIEISDTMLVDIGPASCHDYLYGICEQVKNMEDIEDGEEVAKRLFYIMMLQIVRAIIIKDKNGEEHTFKSYDKIIEIFDKHMTPAEFNIIQSIYRKSEEEYRIGFSIKNIVCPHCQTVTERVSIEPKQLVFQIRQTMLSTQVTLGNFQLF